MDGTRRGGADAEEEKAAAAAAAAADETVQGPGLMTQLAAEHGVDETIHAIDE